MKKQWRERRKISIDDDALGGANQAARRGVPPTRPPRLTAHSPLRHHLAESAPILIDAAEPHERLLLHPRGGGVATRLLLFLAGGMGDVPVFSLHDDDIGWGVRWGIRYIIYGREELILDWLRLFLNPTRAARRGPALTSAAARGERSEMMTRRTDQFNSPLGYL